LLLQPIVENAIKYAIAQSEEGGTIRISARCSDDRLLLVIDDTGPDDLSEEKSQNMTSEDVSGVGIGLQNIRDRLATLYGERCSVTHEPSPLGGRRVSIAIPAAEQYELAS